MIEIYPSSKIKPKLDKLCGIYCIVHTRSKRKYIGSSQEIEKRLALHQYLLRINKHHCKYLQNLWNSYGEESFKYWLIESCEIQNLLDYEQYYIDKTPSKLLLNSAKFVESPNRGINHSEETKLKMSISAIRVAQDPEERKRRSERAKKQHREGRIGRRKLIIKTRICRDCSKEFALERDKLNKICQNRLCRSCRPEKLIRYCSKCKDRFPRKLTLYGVLSQTRLCNNCRPNSHQGGNYKNERKIVITGAKQESIWRD